MGLHDKLKLFDSVCHVAVIAPNSVEPGVNGLCSLFTQETKAYFPMLEEVHYMVFQHVNLWGGGGPWETVPVALEELLYLALCQM